MREAEVENVCVKNLRIWMKVEDCSVYLSVRGEFYRTQGIKRKEEGRREKGEGRREGNDLDYK